MPIIFPSAAVQVVEKIVEKVVEKIVYVAADLYAKFRLTYQYTGNISLPGRDKVAEVLVSVYTKIIGPVKGIVTIVHTYVSNPSTPSPYVIGSTLTYAAAMFCPSLPKIIPYITYSITDTITMPETPITYETDTYVQVHSVTCPNPYLSYSMVEDPTRPTVTDIYSISPTVDKRKTP